MANNNQTFPGVYTTVTDNSFVPVTTSPFLPGLIGVATKGPFDTPTVCTSLNDYVSKFGTPLTTSFLPDGSAPVGSGYYLADAVVTAAPFTNSITVVRVGNQYTSLAVANGSGSAGSYTLKTSVAQSQQLNPALSPSSNVYIRVQEDGKASTINAQVTSAANGTVSLLASGPALGDSYDGAATISYSYYPNAASTAESVLYAYTYGSNSSQTADFALTQFGTITGTKNQFQFVVQSAGTQISVGSVYKIRETGHSATTEIRVKQVIGNTVYLETANLTEVGYQALPLQDNYDAGTLYQVTGDIPYLYLNAAQAGSWANGANSATGLYVQVSPGSAPDSRKLSIYWNSSLVELFDNLSSMQFLADGITPNPNYYTNAINGISQYIAVTEVTNPGGSQIYHPANTVAPWNTAYYSRNVLVTPISMPVGAINAGSLTIPPATTAADTGGQFSNGDDGANPQDSDFIGTINPSTDQNTGLQAFTDEGVTINILAAPMDKISIAVEQELARIAGLANALAVADVPAGLTARQAIDWHNGHGVYEGRGRIDNYRLAVYWNWVTITDNFSGLTKLAPPTIAALYALGYTFTADFPWYAAAGLTRGQLPNVSGIQYGTISSTVRQAMYGNGNSVNPIINQNGQIVLWGDRTMQVAESKLVEIHAVNLVNAIVEGLGNIGIRFVFEPNDTQLLTLIKLAFSQFLDGVKNQRGLEAYQLVIDSTNNTPATRNKHQVIVDLAIIPADVAETIFINVTVNASGATLNTVTT